MKGVFLFFRRPIDSIVCFGGTEIRGNINAERFSDNTITVDQSAHKSHPYLRLEAVHNVHDQDGNVAERRPSVPQITERFVTGSVDDQQAGDFELEIFHILKGMKK